MADTYTTNLNLTKPEPGAAEDTWGISLNSDLDTLDAIFSSSGTQVNLNPNQVNFADNKKAIFGTGSDLEIYHNGSHSFISESGTGNLQIQAQNLSLEDSTGTRFLLGIQGGETRLYNQGNQKVAIQTTGIDVTGTVTSDGFTAEGDATIKGGSDVSNTGATLQLESTETQAVGSGASISFKGDDGSGTQRVFGVIKGSKTSATSGNFNGGLDFFTRVTAEGNARKRLAIASNGDISFYDDTGTTQGFFWDASAESLGIGTTSPSEKLDIVSASSVNMRLNNTGNNVSLSIGAQSSAARITAGSGDRLGLGAGNTQDILNIASGGNIGIGTTSPANGLLNIQGTSNQISLDTGTAGDGRLHIGHFNAGCFIGTYGDDGGAADNLRFGTHSGDERMRITSTGNVGINTTSPDALLEINKGSEGEYLRVGGDNASNARSLRFTSSTASGSSVGALHTIKANSVGGEIAFANGNGNIMYLNVDKKVGIGTSSPNSLLEISSATGSSSITPTELRISSSTQASDWSLTEPWGVLGFYSADTSGGGAGSLAEISANMENTVGGFASLDFKLQNSAQSYAKTSWLTLKNSSSFATRQVLIEADGGLYVEGNVGIGTSSPNAKLTVQNGIQRINSTDGSSDARIQFSMTDGSNVPTGWVGIPSWNKDALYIFGPTATANESAAFYTDATWVFQTGGAERARIDSNGKLGVNTTSLDGILTLKQLANSDSNGLDGIRIDASTGTTYAGFGLANATGTLAITAGDAGGTENTEIVFKTASSGSESERARIDSSGNFGIGTTSPTSLLSIGTTSSQTISPLDVRKNGANIEFGHTNTGAGYYGTIGAFGNSGFPYLGFSTDCENNVNTFSTRGHKGNIIYGDLSGNLIFAQATQASATGQTPTERARIDSSGNFLVGKTSATISTEGVILANQSYFTRSGGNTAFFNRTSSDGNIIAFGKDGSTVGSIRSFAGDLEIQTGITGLRFNDDDDAIHPVIANGSVSDNLTDLGLSNARFKDLHLGGIAYTNNIRAAGGNNLALQTDDGVARVTILDSGLVGVGATSPETSLHVLGSKANESTPILRVQNNSSTNNVGAYVDFENDGGSTIGTIGTREGGQTNVYITGGNTGLKLQSYLTFRAVLPVGSDGTNADDVIDLGSSSVRFDDVYATNGTIQTSDRNEKQDIEYLSDAETRVAVAAKGLLKKYRWKSAVADKGDDARIHFGIMAQDLQNAFANEGLDAGDYGMFISDTWTDEVTGEEQTRLGVRYNELLAFIIAAI